MLTDVRLDIGATEPVEPFGPARSGPRTTTLDPPVKRPRVVTGFVNAYTQYTTRRRGHGRRRCAAPESVDLTASGAHLIAAIDPERTILARAGLRITVGATRLADLVATDRFRQGRTSARSWSARSSPSPSTETWRVRPGSLPARRRVDPRRHDHAARDQSPLRRGVHGRRQPRDEPGAPVAAHTRPIGAAHRSEPSGTGSTVKPTSARSTNSARNRRLGTNCARPVRGRNRAARARRPASALPELDRLRDAVSTRPSVGSRPAPGSRCPVFGGKLEPDITFVGFDLTAEDVEPEPGWFFVIQEQPTEPRFGLDEPDGRRRDTGDLVASSPGLMSASPPGGHLPLAAITPPAEPEPRTLRISR